ncbi:MAG: metallophosphoesterase [Lachnospiraceae bacterium]|nr:metallophosphoesterase [Lachnospiraceae bacterium]
MMKILHTADWHIGSFKGPEKDGVNLRSLDTMNCLARMVDVAREEKPELVLVSGDIFDRAEIWQGRSHKEVLQARHIIMELSQIAEDVIVMRGTPNHDSSEAFEELAAHFELVPNVKIIVTPQVISLRDFDIAVLPGFERGTFRAKNPGLSKEKEHEVFTKELSNIVMGLKAECYAEKASILMSHYTIPGCNAESGQLMMLTQFEPILPPDVLSGAGFDLVAMGHIHRPQKLDNVPNCFYSGAINALNFNDEGQERGFWIHEFGNDVVRRRRVYWSSEFFKTPYREFITFHFTDPDITAINTGDIDAVAMKYWRYDGSVQDKIVRIFYECSLENHKAFKANESKLDRVLYDDGAFHIWETLPEKVEENVNRTVLSGTGDPEENLRRYLEEKEVPEEKIQELILKARPIIARAEAGLSVSSSFGLFEPVEIEVRNYRNYESEKFSFEDINFCTINGANGAGKSSLFMDAIVDCLYEDSREGGKKQDAFWVRNDEKAKSGAIIFTFRIGDKTFRVTRTRAKSGKATLNISELLDGEWQDRSMEKIVDTQNEIENLIGMDCLTFKSCALIMQDQYGLFLQAPKEDRMVILGTLLGLGVYDPMYRNAADLARECGARKRDLAQKAAIHEATIVSLGNPEVELEAERIRLQEKEAGAKAVTAARDSKKVELLSLQEAQERANRLADSIASLSGKKADTEKNRGYQKDIIASCSAALEREETIAEKAARYRELDGKKRDLQEQTTLFTSKQLEVAKLTRTVTALEDESKLTKVRLESEKAKLQAYDPAAEEEILQKAEEYQATKALLDEQILLEMKYRDADREVIEARLECARVQRDINSLDEHLATVKSYYGKQIGILSASGCINIENADCLFLKEAKAAKTNLEAEQADYDRKRAAFEKELAGCMEAVTRAEEEKQAIRYDPEKKADIERKCTELYPYVSKAKQAENRSREMTMIQLSIDNLQTKAADLDLRLEEAMLERGTSETELEQYRAAFDEAQKLDAEMVSLGPWLEQEKQLPVLKERLSNATTRVAELELQLAEQEKEISVKQLELSREMMKTTGLSEKEMEVNTLNRQLEVLDQEIKAINMSIGSLTEKLTQAEALKKEREALQVQIMETAKETADYDTLKMAFSQDGIPHQIIRTIVPILESTANNILGQMTGGKMGVSFRTEMVQENGKEKAALDIFIEEYGKAPLPYLSKSGGEKVKASLSVILSLAEIKSSSAGIQLGMLFIDEPPFLDSDGIQAYCDALETIQRRYDGIKIMAITHDPTMKARFPQNLDVIKTEQGSKVIYQ